jgi:hypothetical protein
MTATVPELRNTAIYSGVQIARSVRGVTWIDVARLQCWLAGRGSMDVPVYAPNVTIAGGSTSAFRFWTKPRYATTRYAYGLILRGATPGTASVAIPTGGTAQSVEIGTRASPRPVTLYADRSAQSNAEAELSIDITAPAGLDVIVESLSIEAVPRAFLQTVGSDLGADRLRLLARQVIADATLSTETLDRMNELRQEARRTGLIQLSRGTDSPWSTTSGTPADVLPAGLAALGRYLYNAEVEREVYWRILAKCSDGTTAGQLDADNVSHGAAASSIAIPTGTTSWTWLPAAGAEALLIDCEDNTSADGYQGAAADEHNFPLSRTAGAGTVQVATISIFEGNA